MTLPLSKGNRVEDRRIKKIWPEPDDQKRYKNIYGTVTEATVNGFKVSWDEGYTMGYAWEFFGESGIRLMTTDAA